MKRTSTCMLFLALSVVCCPVVTWARTVDLRASFDIQGEVGDMQQQIKTSGLRFRVDLQDIVYSGKVQRTIVEMKEDGHFTIWVALQGAELTIRRTEIKGQLHRAECGPVTIVLGTRRHLWVAFDAERTRESGSEKIDLVRTRFRLPRDNWEVGSPDWVKTSGFGITQSKVTEALRSGLEKNAAAIEKHMIRAAPKIFLQVEDQIAGRLRGKVLVASKSPKANRRSTAKVRLSSSSQ